MLNEWIEQKNISIYRLAKNSGIPYSTISDICSGKTQIEKCSAETIYKLAKELDVTMEDLLEPYINKRVSFELYKSNVCHRVKEKGDVNFIIEILEKDEIRKYYSRQWYPESLYLLAMLDYLSRLHDIPLCSEYNDLRKCRLADTIYPSSILAEAIATNDQSVKEKAKAEAIPEFMRFNIVENEVWNVV